jgi:hypothetical protein
MDISALRGHTIQIGRVGRESREPGMDSLYTLRLSTNSTLSIGLGRWRRPSPLIDTLGNLLDQPR